MRRSARRIALFFVCLALAGLTGCAPEKTARYTCRVTDIFDTEITLSGFARDQSAFDEKAQRVMDRLRTYHQMLDGYNAYGDLHNLWYVNHHAAQAPVQVPKEFYDLLVWCRDQWQAGRQTVNIAMGSVLKIWHEYRVRGIADPASAALPSMEELQEASRHTDFSAVRLDDQNHTVYFTDPQLQLDLGAVAKGYAADLVLPLLKKEMPSFLLSLGGNVYAGDAPKDGRDHWNVGVQDPRMGPEAIAQGGTDILDVMEIKNLTAVTSGDYWRYYEVDGRRYHHIIDPGTLFPAAGMQSVTIVCESSLLADYLSTSLFILSQQDGEALMRQFDGVEAMWVDKDGTITYSDGCTRYSRNAKKAYAQMQE